MNATVPQPIPAFPALASISAFCAAWMAMMATRYFGLSAGDINGGIGVGVDSGSWLSTAYFDTYLEESWRLSRTKTCTLASDRSRTSGRSRVPSPGPVGKLM